MQPSYTQQIALLGGILIGAVVFVAALVPVFAPIVRLPLP